jgi:hypothetical protein
MDALLAQRDFSDLLDIALYVAIVALSALGWLAKKLIDHFGGPKAEGKEIETDVVEAEEVEEPREVYPAGPVARPMPPLAQPATGCATLSHADGATDSSCDPSRACRTADCGTPAGPATHRSSAAAAAAEFTTTAPPATRVARRSAVGTGGDGTHIRKRPCGPALGTTVPRTKAAAETRTRGGIRDRSTFAGSAASPTRSARTKRGA